MAEINSKYIQDLEKLKKDHLDLSNLVNNLLKDQDSQKLKIELLQSQLLEATERLDQQAPSSNPQNKHESLSPGPDNQDLQSTTLLQYHDRELKRIKEYLEAMREQDENQTMTFRYMSDTMKNNYDTLENSINEKLELLASTMDSKLTNLPGISAEIDSKLDLKLAELAEKLLNNPKQGKEGKSVTLASEIMVRQINEQQKQIRNEIAENNLKIADINAIIDGFKDLFSDQISHLKVDSQVAIAELNENVKKAFENILAVEARVQTGSVIQNGNIDSEIVDTLKEELNQATEAITFLENKFEHILARPYSEDLQGETKYTTPSKSPSRPEERSTRSPKKDIDGLKARFSDLETRFREMEIDFEGKLLSLRVGLLSDIFERVVEDPDDPTLNKLNVVEAKFGKMLGELNSSIKKCIEDTENIHSSFNMIKDNSRVSYSAANFNNRISAIQNRESKFLFAANVPEIKEEEPGPFEKHQRISTLQSENEEDKIVEKDDDNASQSSTVSYDEKKPGAAKKKFETLSALIKQMSSRVNSLEATVTHIQENTPSNPEAVITEGEITKIWETINNLIQNTQEQFERIKNQPSKSRTHSRQPSKDMDLTRISSVEIKEDHNVQQKLESFVNPLVEKINEHVNALFERITQQEQQVKKLLDENFDLMKTFTKQKEESINKMVEGSQLYKMIFNKGNLYNKSPDKAPLDMLAENFRGLWDTINLLSERILTVEQKIKPGMRDTSFRV